MTLAHSSHTLPIDAVLDEISRRLEQHQNLLLVAEPGAGKTTRVPLALLESAWLAGKQIIMLEPRRLAARNAARFMAQQLGQQVGDSVGYRIRLENRSSDQTRILVVTEGILTRMLQSDPELKQVGLIIFDEFHERHLNSDLSLALAHQCQQLLRDDLKLLVMSATLDSDKLGELLQAPIVRCPGRSYPVTMQYRPRNNAQASSIDHCARIVTTVLNDPEPSGHMLVFLPGTREIQQLKRTLDESLPADDHTLVLPLHGRLTDKEQKRALAPVSDPIRKVILATNIAESSLTLDGVRIVIDSGLEKRLMFNPGNGISRLVSRRISQASSVQRAGRAGRQAPGWCYRLWPETEQSRLTAHIEAEIVQTDLSQLRMELLQWGAEPEELLWLTPPPAPALAQAQSLLGQLGLLEKGQLTERGKRTAPLGLEPRWASALLHASSDSHNPLSRSQQQQACELIAMLQSGIASLHSDDIERQWLSRHRLPDTFRQRWNNQVVPLARRWLHALPAPSPSNDNPAELDIARVIALAWPDRIARLRSGTDGSRYQLSNGTGARLLPDSSLQGATYLAVVDTSESRDGGILIRSAIALQETRIQALSQQIPGLTHERIKIEWQDSGALLAESQRCIGHWVWQRERLDRLSHAQWQQAWSDWFSTSAGLLSLPWDDRTRQLQARMTQVQKNLEPDWPDVSDGGLIERRQAWLVPWMEGVKHRRELKSLNLYDLLLNQLSWEQQQQLDSWAPSHWKVTSGSRIQLDYLENPPVLAVKLQELFGYEEQPAVLRGQQPLMIHLLSPARRPVQITQDLPHFWRNSYDAVRKDLRGKYPKHPWPENPLNAEATALTNRALRARK